MLGGQALRVAVELLAWLETLPVAAAAAVGEEEVAEAAEGERGEVAAGGAAGAPAKQVHGRAEPSIRVLPLRHGLAAPGGDGGDGGGGALPPLPGQRSVPPGQRVASWV
ncbi:hypothetical protein MNEG_4556 [Monoraphidium neglectum]|uniref:Secreted protein n=1 Tax=Monoraphidium neglectum TaxID=145388 RepID=A0A0D2MSK1_9CHLO|nr:hypothetical protein MNEG_4556 [Monoraphidium neglectum]KIZ03407.1 hypothetical protein MNEG_4556 [Monoraphidium neglectum]|eukprot:XP_013902426.1 hypothetical protein MNEG_4556 [Monoraphidium neglectum]